MKLLFLLAVVLVALMLVGRAGRLPEAMQQYYDDSIGPMLGGPSREFAAFQTFATALVRGDMTTVGTLTEVEGVKDQTSRTYLLLRRDVRDVLQVAYRADSERPAADGKTSTLVVSQGLTLDPHGVTSAFGTLTCEGQYEVAMTETPAGWKVSSLTVKPPASQPMEPKFFVVAERQVRWPCADSAWTKFATAWKSTVTQ